MKLKASFCFCIVFVLLFGGKVSAQDADAEIAKKLWEQVIAAKGGREKLHSVTNMLVTKGNQPDDLGVFLDVFPYKRWRWTKGPPGPKTVWVSMVNAEYGVIVTANNEGLVSNDRVTKERRNLIGQENLQNACIYLLETKRLQPKPLRVTRSTIKDQTFDVIETRLENKEIGYTDRLDFAVDPESLMVMRVFDYGGNVNRKEPLGVTCFDNYHPVDGLQMPQASYERLFKKLTDKCYFNPLSVETNVEYDKELFDKQTFTVAGSDAWKPKLIE